MVSSEHTQKSFDADLGKLHSAIVELGDMVSKELDAAMDALSHHDANEAAEVGDVDISVNLKERHIDDLAIRIIALRQPMATDLRFIISSLQIARDLERIGDYAENIADHTLTLAQMGDTGVEAKIVELGAKVKAMLAEILETFTSRDVKRALEIRNRDVENDSLYTDIFRELLNMNCGAKGKSSACVHLLFVARSLERIGDHITNIAEHVVYIVTGKVPADSRPKADLTAFLMAEE